MTYSDEYSNDNLLHYSSKKGEECYNLGYINNAQQKTGHKIEEIMEQNNKIINSGIGQRMLDKIIIGENKIRKGIKSIDCNFSIIIDHYEKIGGKRVYISIKYPRYDGKEDTIFFSVGQYNKNNLVFNNSFGSISDNPLNNEQKDIILNILKSNENII